MVHALEEVEDFAPLAKALVDQHRHALAALGRRRWSAPPRPRSNAAGVPWILDPGGGRRHALPHRGRRPAAGAAPAVVRGNASEIMALAGEAGGALRASTAPHGSDAARDAARARWPLASGAVVAVTGAVDYVTDGERMVAIANGDMMLTRVTGTGCTATALIGAFLGAGLPAFDAAVAGLAAIGVAGESRGRTASPGRGASRSPSSMRSTAGRCTVSPPARGVREDAVALA